MSIANYRRRVDDEWSAVNRACHSYAELAVSSPGICRRSQTAPRCDGGARVYVIPTVCFPSRISPYSLHHCLRQRTRTILFLTLTLTKLYLILHVAIIGVARILSGVHYFLPKKLTTFFSRRPKRTSKYTSKSNPPSKNCPKNWLLLCLGSHFVS